MKLPKHRRDEAALNSRLIRRPIKRMVWLFLLPTFGAFCIGFLYPFFKGLFLSFCNFRITSQWTWTGLDNYRKAFQDPGYMHAFWYTALFALVSLLAINLFAFTIAYALTQKFKGTNVFRTGKCPGRGSVPGGYSDSSTPVAAISSYNLRFSAGYTTSTPPPRTAAVKPPACKAPRMAAPSMPLAMPDTTTAPCRASS